MFCTTDGPSVSVRVIETCISSVTISLIINNHPACGIVSQTVVLHLNKTVVLLPVSDRDAPEYKFDRLNGNAMYDITIKVTYNNNTNSRIFVRSVKTLGQKCKL